MEEPRPDPPSLVSGDEFRPARGKLWGMLIVFALMIPVGAVAAFCWWLQIPVFRGIVLAAKAGIVGLLGIPLGMFLAVVAGILLASAKTLVIGDDRVQFISRGQVVIEIPFRNVAAIYAKGEGDAGVVGLKLRDRRDPATRVPSWTKDSYEIQVLTYGKSVEFMRAAIDKRFQAYRTQVGGQ